MHDGAVESSQYVFNSKMSFAVAAGEPEGAQAVSSVLARDPLSTLNPGCAPPSWSCLLPVHQRAVYVLVQRTVTMHRFWFRSDAVYCKPREHDLRMRTWRSRQPGRRHGANGESIPTAANCCNARHRWDTRSEHTAMMTAIGCAGERSQPSASSAASPPLGSTAKPFRMTCSLEQPYKCRRLLPGADAPRRAPLNSFLLSDPCLHGQSLIFIGFNRHVVNLCRATVSAML